MFPQIRMNILNEISKIVIDSDTRDITYKLDYLATVKISGFQYFNVFRRYNNVHEIVIEDYNNDFHFQKDDTFRNSIQSVLCLSDEQMKTITIQTLHTFKMNGTPSFTDAILNMKWSQIQSEYHGFVIGIGGILEDYHQFMKQRYPSSFPYVDEKAPAIIQEVKKQGDAKRSSPTWTKYKGTTMEDRFAEIYNVRWEERWNKEEREEQWNDDEVPVFDK
jgi:hypothetical protein